MTNDIGVGSRLFLTAAPDLTLGSGLASGHWSREVLSWVLAQRGADGSLTLERDALHVILELAWETVRLREFPQRPSHLDCLFLWTDEEAARAWHYRKHVLRASNAGLYEVEVMTCERACAADMNLISFMDDGETLGTLMERARRYWRGEGGDGPPEVLLEGSVVIRRNLLALAREALQAVEAPLTDRTVHAALRWTAAGEAPWSLTRVREKRYHLEGTLVAEPGLPLPLAGWIGVEIEGQEEPILARRGTPPVFVRPGESCRVSAAVTDLPSLPGGTRCRPVLLCDRAAAYYWQLQPFWEGRLSGDWQVAGGDDPQP